MTIDQALPDPFWLVHGQNGFVAYVYITSKLNNGFHRSDDARETFDATLARLGSDCDYLFLIPACARYIRGVGFQLA